MPVLDFCFLIYEDGGKWMGRSVLTGHVSEGSSYDSAFLGLTRAIDNAIYLANKNGVSTRDWYDSQQPDAVEFLVSFVDATAHDALIRREEKAPSANVFINASIAKQEAA